MYMPMSARHGSMTITWIHVELFTLPLEMEATGKDWLGSSFGMHQTDPYSERQVLDMLRSILGMQLMRIGLGTVTMMMKLFLLTNFG